MFCKATTSWHEWARGLLAPYCPCPVKPPATRWNLTFRSSSLCCNILQPGSNFLKRRPPTTYGPWHCRGTAEQRKTDSILLLASRSQMVFRAELKALSFREFSSGLKHIYCNVCLTKLWMLDVVLTNINKKPQAAKGLHYPYWKFLARTQSSPAQKDY